MTSSSPDLVRYWGIGNSYREEFLSSLIRTIESGGDIDSEELQSKTSRSLSEFQRDFDWLCIQLRHRLETHEEVVHLSSPSEYYIKSYKYKFICT